jgi:cellulose synthase/poly-beta-1,6-N-acetylglucosamine synthase-like glycosyltransferase
MFEMVQVLAGTNLFLLAFSMLIFDIPRYTLSLVSLALFGVRRRSNRVPAGNASVSVIIPTFNGASGLDRSIASLHRQTLRPVEIIVVDDGSTDETRAVAERARALGLVDMVICHGTRCGRSAAINAAARFRAAGRQPDGRQSSKYGVDGKAARAGARNAAEGFPYRRARQSSQYR